MNAYSTRGQARIQPRDVSTALRTPGIARGASLAALESQRGWQAEAEVERLLKQYGVKPRASTSHLSLLRQVIGAALVRAGEYLAGSPGRDAPVESIPSTGTLGTAS